ncbi:hypothetical protein [Catenuloplanes atrovinosus]|uniref:Heme A synthase n=1 Tax=Catenuloplanes atrovinosus TaxID=137266 RepID=A0AAE4CF59_9ACTN|nr:hypothetical protein [Catenuloplanes atrovinosus]MDR7279300.1 heme A synthase [Catenuloplanes atrovinosus]
MERYRRATAAARRMTAVPFAVRAALVLVGTATLLVAVPVEYLDVRSAGLALLLALFPALAPRGFPPAALAVTAITLYAVATAGYGEPIVLGRVLALASLLYAGHSLAALAACLPYDAAIRAEVVTGWVIRLLAVLLGSAVVLVMVLAAVGRVTLGGYAAFAIGGLAAAVAATALLARISR